MFLFIKTDTADKSIVSDIGLSETDTIVTGVLASILASSLLLPEFLQKGNITAADRIRGKMR
jgi:hypothetical protein